MGYIINRRNVSASLPWPWQGTITERWRIRPEGLNAVRTGYANVDTPAFSWKVGDVVPWRLDPLQQPGGARGLRGLTFDGTGLFGTGLFSSGLDITQWSIWEWGIVGLGVFMVAGGGLKLGSSKAARRKKLAVARAKYQLEAAEA